MNTVNDPEKKVVKAREIKGETMDRRYLYTVPTNSVSNLDGKKKRKKGKKKGRGE